MPSVKSRGGRIGDPMSCIALVPPWGLVQRRLFRMPPGDKTPFRLRRRQRTMSNIAGKWRSF